MILLCLLAFLLYKFRLSDTVVSAAVVAIYIISVFVAGFLAGKTMEKQKYLWGLCIGGAYFGVLLLVSLLCGQSPGNIGGDFVTTLLLCTAGGMLGGMVS